MINSGIFPELGKKKVIARNCTMKEFHNAFEI